MAPIKSCQQQTRHQVPPAPDRTPSPGSSTGGVQARAGGAGSRQELPAGGHLPHLLGSPRTPRWRGPVLACVLPCLHPALGCHRRRCHLPALPAAHQGHPPPAGRGGPRWGGPPSPGPLPSLRGAGAGAAGVAAAAAGPRTSPVAEILRRAWGAQPPRAPPACPEPVRAVGPRRARPAPLSAGDQRRPIVAAEGAGGRAGLRGPRAPPPLAPLLSGAAGPPGVPLK